VKISRELSADERRENRLRTTLTHEYGHVHFHNFLFDPALGYVKSPLDRGAKGKLSKNAIAEGIINNVRKTIIRDQLTDPRFYSQMSALLEDLIQQSRLEAAAYEEFLKKAEALVKQLAQKQSQDGVPASLHGRREAAVLYNNLGFLPATTFQCPADESVKAELALDIDYSIRECAPAGWKGDQAREAQVLNTLYPLLDRDRDATRALFEIIKNQPGY